MPGAPRQEAQRLLATLSRICGTLISGIVCLNLVVFASSGYGNNTGVWDGYSQHLNVADGTHLSPVRMIPLLLYSQVLFL